MVSNYHWFLFEHLRKNTENDMSHFCDSPLSSFIQIYLYPIQYYYCIEFYLLHISNH